MAKHREYYKGKRWWVPPSLGYGESCEFVFAYGSFVHQKCSHYALTNLLFGLCRFVWIIEPLVALPSPNHLQVVFKVKTWQQNVWPQGDRRMGAHKAQLVNRYDISPIAMGQIPPKSLIMVKRWATPRTRAIRGGMWPYAIWKQSWNKWGNPLTKSFGWK